MKTLALIGYFVWQLALIAAFVWLVLAGHWLLCWVPVCLTLSASIKIGGDK